MFLWNVHIECSAISHLVDLDHQVDPGHLIHFSSFFQIIKVYPNIAGVWLSSATACFSFCIVL